ncbi:pentatricopeptide repeat-containing At2g30780-like isoform X2 [Olea europaea subsp. europaea]|uniref:Pentatricopeptide repeat-containing At2g30780-like isoform X2 n=2 Tax=Olea europaea subsp. europaea TaxID=158383 RepID=A0A8S0Q420_OLEEU|nr:pentatricopeptide repeat-containing At2g30780-like isoform X2 [Olea europaea subsp. europaea]
MRAIAGCGRFLLPKFRSKSYPLIGLISERNITTSPSSSSSHGPLLQKLLKEPISRIKATLESEFNSRSEFPWSSLLSLLNNSSSQKANMVVEWRLEKLTEQSEENHDCYLELISLCGSIRNLPMALQIFTTMETRGLKPTPSVFNALISTCLSSGNLLTALSLFEIMENSEGYKPDSDTYHAFISWYANSGNKKATEAWYSSKRASGFSPDLRTYDFLILSCTKSRNFSDAERYYEEMMLAGLMPNVSILQNMLLLYCEQRNSSKVKELLQIIIEGGCRINKLIAKEVVEFFNDFGTVEDMEELLVTYPKSEQVLEIHSMVHSSFIRMYAKADRLDDVEYSVGRMLKDGISFDSPDDVEKVICCYFRKGAHDRLDVFLECIKGYYKFTRSIYDLLVAGYRRAGLSEKLNSVVDEMKQAGFA